MKNEPMGLGANSGAQVAADYGYAPPIKLKGGSRNNQSNVSKTNSDNRNKRGNSVYADNMQLKLGRPMQSMNQNSV